MVLYLMLYICAFLNARTILEFFNKIPIRILYTFVIAIAGTIALFYFKLTNTYIETYCCLICATIIFALLVRLFSNADNNKIIAYISSISFEIYLVHHTFCFGKYSLYKIIPNPFLGTIAIFITSFVLACLLKQISSGIKNITCKK